MEQDQGEAALLADIGYLRALVQHTIPLAAVPDGLTAKRIRRSAGEAHEVTFIPPPDNQAEANVCRNWCG